MNQSHDDALRSGAGNLSRRRVAACLIVVAGLLASGAAAEGTLAKPREQAEWEGRVDRGLRNRPAFAYVV